MASCRIVLKARIRPTTPVDGSMTVVTLGAPLAPSRHNQMAEGSVVIVLMQILSKPY